MTAPVLPPGCPAVLTSSEVASLYRVDPSTVTKWAKEKRVTAVRLGARGNYRYPSGQFAEALAETGWPL
jgi:hypothetical protein